MAKGWVYVTSNSELPGLVKVGFSTKVPSVRAEELSSTGLPEPHGVFPLSREHTRRCLQDRRG